MFDHNISVPHTFFRKAKKEYRNWIMAMFRELIQNSYDAKASQIDFNLEEEDDYFTLTCTDNGKGMDKDTLINVLLCLGGSKKDEDAIGGFGYAKTLLFFAHEHYIIKTRDNIVEGIGGNYSHHTTDDYVEGVSVSIQIAKEDSEDYYTFYRFKSALEEILSFSKLKNTTVTWQGEIQPMDVFSFDYKHSTPIGNLNFKDQNDAYSSKLWVRINGLAMFEHYVYSNTDQAFLGILDLNKNPIEVLTSNRDSLKGESEAEFNKIFKTLQDERSSLKTHKLLDWILNETNLSLSNDTAEEEMESSQGSIAAFSETTKTYHQNKKENIFEKRPAKATFSPFQVLIEDNEKTLKKLKKLFSQLDNEEFPINFVIQQGENLNKRNFEIKNTLNKKSSIKLARKWKKIVYSILESLPETVFIAETGLQETYSGQEGQFFYHSRPVNVGFVLKNNNRAVNSQSSKSINILLNPISLQNTTRLSNLYDVAFHEVAHIFRDYHDESFCGIEMELKWKFREYWNTPEIRKMGDLSF